MSSTIWVNISRWAVFWCKRAILRVICRTFFLMTTVLLLSVTIMAYGSDFSPVDHTLVRGRQGNITFGVARAGGSVPTENSSLGFRAAEYVSVNRSIVNVTQLTKTPIEAKSVFIQKYANHYPENDTDFLVDISRITKWKWQRNTTSSQIFRNGLRDALGDMGKPDKFILSKQNVQLGEKINFYRHKAFTRISKQLWQLLPKDSLYKPGMIQRCSVVGSSGILQGSNCGHKIDSSDYVFRFNLADVKGYEIDVGIKTNFTTMNPSFLITKFNSLKKTEDRLRFRNLLNQFKGSHLFLPAFAFKWRYYMLIQAASVAKRYTSVRPIFGHPGHYASVANLWQRTLNGSRWTTTGLHVLSSIFDVCDKIDVYGFWPFATSLDGRVVPYHYHNDINGTRAHSFSKEFRGLVDLHERGILHLHTGSCS
ncbi:alpha-N-acetylneuraminide alpha-2,8-sialyltransferase-like [Acanthaster planci]|uniref:Alpha-N-acetylneuraminide alpha-2,8-sialyltransferase-like n=1 Tax=Acanthaster planci TaxID=133434 RepID=A0A8B7YBK7_ACAPL|nr:alpha-N-acetylneuraminide alpha-2,8-sialyltransferase-like [Acanthaster planci]